MQRVIQGIVVSGVEVGPLSECCHYHSPLDIVALKCECCETFWCCHLCHLEVVGQDFGPVSVRDAETEVVMCGACGRLMSAPVYLALYDEGASPKCPNCAASFNPGCGAHKDLYFRSQDPIDEPDQ